MAHRIGDTLFLLIRKHAATCIAYHLSKAHNDVKRSTYLVGYVLDKGRFLSVGLLNHLGGMQQFLVFTLSLLTDIANTAHVEVERLEHRGKAVLQSTDNIGSCGARDINLHIARGYNLCFIEQLI